MGLRASKLPWRGRTVRPDILRLEDRVVPGEMFGTSMLWAMGAFADPTAFIPDSATNDAPQSALVRATPNADSTPSLPYVDSSTLTICQIDSSVGFEASAPPADDTPAAAPTTGTSDEVFSGMTSDTDFDNLFDGLPGQAAPMGDLLHPGAQTPAASNAAIGGAAGAQSNVAAFNFTTPATSGGGGQASRGAALAAAAGMTGAAGTAATTTATAPAASTAAAPAGDGGAVNTPFLHKHAVAAPNKAHPDAANGAAPFSPAQIQQAYGFNLISNNGSGQTIYIIDAYNDPNIAADLHTFDTQWGLPDPSLTVHKMSSRVRNSSSWGVEESLDVEWAHAIAPAANIVLVEATSASNSALFSAVDWATNNGAHIVSMSFGGSDTSSDSSYDTHFNHAGVTYLASSGDTASALEYPAASPYVLSVGGTSLTLTTSNAYSSESAWSSGGGGVSGFEARPGYQTSYGITNSKRSIPDVSFDADPNTGVYVYDTFYAGGGGWFQVGGTSLSAPAWAGLIALADQGRSTPLSTNSLTSRIEYNAASGSVYASNYHDITTGSNGHAATTGYDLATGVGTPQANNLVPWLSSN